MSAKISEKTITARWLQAIVITCVMYLMMGMSQSESTSSKLSQWRSFHAAAPGGYGSPAHGNFDPAPFASVNWVDRQ